MFGQWVPWIGLIIGGMYMPEILDGLQRNGLGNLQRLLHAIGLA